MDNSPDMLILPVTYLDNRIRYSFSINYSLANTELSDYYISNILEDNLKLRLLYNSPNFYFYKIDKTLNKKEEK